MPYNFGECRRALAPTLSQRRQAELGWVLEQLEFGARPIVEMAQTQKVRALSYFEAPGLDGGPIERLPIIRAVIFSEGIKRDGDEVMMRGLDTRAFRASPRMFFAHRTSEDPVGNWLPETIRMVLNDPTVGKSVIEAHGRPLALDDGSDTARRSRTVFRMLTADPPGYDTFSGSWIPEDVEPIYNKRRQIVGIRHLKGQVTEASVAPLPADTDARMRVAELLKSGRSYAEGGIDRRDVDFFSRVAGDTRPYFIRGLMADEEDLAKLDLEEVGDALTAARVAVAAAQLRGDLDGIAVAEAQVRSAEEAIEQATATAAADSQASEQGAEASAEGPDAPAASEPAAAAASAPQETTGAQGRSAHDPSADRAQVETKLLRFRTAFAPVVEALLAGTLAHDTISRAVASLADTYDLADIEAALRSTLEQTQKMRSVTDTFLTDLAGGALPADPQQRVSKVLSSLNRTRVAQARDLLDQVLEADMPSDPGAAAGEGALPEPGTERTAPDVAQMVVRLHDAVEALRDTRRGEEADAILDELRHAPAMTQVRRLVDSVRTQSPPA